MGRILKVCTINLHGTQENDNLRFSEMASELAELRPDLCALQEVIVDGRKNTAERLAEMLGELTGGRYYTHFVECHPFYGKYPEGVAILSSHPLKNAGAIDLNHLGDLSPLLPRYAAVSEVELNGRRLLFVSVHLDHHKNPMVRKVQVDKLFDGLEGRYHGAYHAVILAGDFNDTEDSLAVRSLRERRFIDTYRTLNDDPGYTFPVKNPSMRIDYILVKGGAKPVSSWRIMGGRGLSDHFGVYAVIGLR